MEHWQLEAARARFLIHKHFGGLIFKEDTHQYFLPQPDGSLREYMCVSNFTHQWVPHVDWEAIKVKKAAKLTRETGKLVTPDDLTQQWKEKQETACSMGTEVHEFAESLGWMSHGEYDRICDKVLPLLDLEKHELIPENTNDKWYLKKLAAKQFWHDMEHDPKFANLHFVMAETQVFTSRGPYAEDYPKNYAGTFDLLMYYEHPTDPDKGGFIIMDYKGLPLDTPILTTNGFVNMGDLKEGMFVYDKDGKAVRILHCSSIHHNPCYKIRFDNNDEIIADIDHRWVISFAKCNGVVDKVMTTKELKEYMDSMPDRRADRIPKIYNPKAIDGEEKQLPIDPYVFGVWLGDGSKDCGLITNPCDDVFEEIKNRGYSVGDDVSHGSSGKAAMRTIYGLRGKLAEIGVLNNKHIPSIYLTASYNQRLDLLRGFMDADGYYHKKRNRFVTNTTHESQKDFIVELLGTLGVKPTVINTQSKCNGKAFKVWDICWFMTEYPFLCRKEEIQPMRKTSYNARNIVSVEECETVPTRCIEVDSVSHTYLATKSCIVTHNTNESLYNTYPQCNMMLPPFDNLKDENKSHYILQASCYQIPMEAIGLKVIGRRLVHFKDEGGYELVPLPDVTDMIKNELRKE